jgi:hypothetical protein
MGKFEMVVGSSKVPGNEVMKSVSLLVNKKTEHERARIRIERYRGPFLI